MSNSDITVFDNPSPRCPVILLLDTSSSMSGAPIQELNRGVRQFFDEIESDEVARFSVETSIITFGNPVKKAMPFTSCTEPYTVPTFTTSGSTPLGEALNIALEDLEERRKFYRSNGLPAYKPWIIIISDGMPNDEWRSAADKAKKKAEAGKLVYLGVGVGNSIDMDMFSEVLPPSCPPKKLDGLKFAEFFKWLSDSLKAVSQSSPGESCTLPPTTGWESIDV